MIKAVICDLDGLLADTEKYHMRAYRETLARYGIDLEDSEYIEHWIRKGEGIVKYIKKHRLPLIATDVRARKAAKYRELVRTEVEAMPEALSFLNRMRGNKRLALASSSYGIDIDLVVDKIGIGDFFETVVSSNDVRQAKPAPDIFVRASELLGVGPEDCVVVEDAQKGVEAAHRAGMRCIAVPNEYTINDDFSRATAVVSSLAEITVEFIDLLV